MTRLEPGTRPNPGTWLEPGRVTACWPETARRSPTHLWKVLPWQPHPPTTHPWTTRVPTVHRASVRPAPPLRGSALPEHVGVHPVLAVQLPAQPGGGAPRPASRRCSLRGRRVSARARRGPWPGPTRPTQPAPPRARRQCPKLRHRPVPRRPAAPAAAELVQTRSPQFRRVKMRRARRGLRRPLAERPRAPGPGAPQSGLPKRAPARAVRFAPAARPWSSRRER